jgi:hypothetical protein
MSTTFNYKTSKKIKRNDSGKIVSIKPFYESDKDPYIIIHTQIHELITFADKFPENKVQVEINSVKEDIYKLLKEDLDHNRNFQDGAGKFFYSPTVNSVIIIHQEI